MLLRRNLHNRQNKSMRKKLIKLYCSFFIEFNIQKILLKKNKTKIIFKHICSAKHSSPFRYSNYFHFYCTYFIIRLVNKLIKYFYQLKPCKIIDAIGYGDSIQNRTLIKPYLIYLSAYPSPALFPQTFIELEHRLAIILVLDLGIRSVRVDHVFRRRSFEDAATLETSRLRYYLQ